MHSPSQILFGFYPIGPLETNFRTRKRKKLVSTLKTDMPSVIIGNDKHLNKLIDFSAIGMQICDDSFERSELKREISANIYNSGVVAVAKRTYDPCDMLMLFDHL